MSEVNDSVVDFLAKSTLNDVLACKEKSCELVSVQLDTTLEQALELMKKHDIIAVFVKEQDTYTDVVEVIDIVNHVIFLPYVAYVKEGYVSFEKFHFSSETIGSLMKNMKNKRTLFSVSTTTSLTNVIQFFSSNGGYHQGIAIGPNNTHHVFCQTDIVKYLFDNQDKMKKLINSRIEDLNLANPYGNTPAHINVKESAFHAFLQLCTEKVRALAVLDDYGQIVGNISASDLRGFNSQQLPKLNQSILDFSKETGGGYVPVTVHSRTLLSEVMLKVVRSKPRIHRVWVINSNQQPVGLLTLSDIISAFCAVVPSS